MGRLKNSAKRLDTKFQLNVLGDGCQITDFDEDAKADNGKCHSSLTGIFWFFIAWVQRHKTSSISAWQLDDAAKASDVDSPEEDKAKASADRPKAKDLWTAYLWRGDGGHRLYRVVGPVLAYMVLAWVLFSSFGYPQRPLRGDVILWFDNVVMIVGTVLTTGLIFMVVDETRLCIRFIRLLAERGVVWPNETLNRFSRSPGSAGRERIDQHEWVTIQLIANRTRTVGRLILLPVFIVVIVAASRLTYFDRIHIPLSLFFIYLINILYALVCAVLLRREASKARRRVIRRMNDCLADAINTENKKRIAQIEHAMEEVRAVRIGAFSPLAENPVLQALLIPTGGATLLAFIERFAVAY